MPLVVPRRRLVEGAVVAAVAGLAQGAALRGGFIWDDAGHVTAPPLQGWRGLLRIWTDPGATQQYYPLLHSAFWIEHRLWGDSAFGYHAINLGWHILAALLFAAVLRRLGAQGAGWAALLFAAHPVTVESVAWVSEQKNTLAMVLALGAAWQYLRFDRRGYRRGTLLFVAALLTKSVTATLPGGIAVALWWRREKPERYLGLLPWLGLGLAAGVFTAWREHSAIGAQGPEFALAGWQRCLLAGRAIVFYAGKLAWPARLSFVYPKWTLTPNSAWALAAVAAITAGCFAWCRLRGRRAPLAAWLYFCGTLFPVLGFVDVYPFLFSYVADHFQYFACLGPFALAGAGIEAVPWFAIVVPVLAGLAARESVKYRSGLRLYRMTLARNPAAWMADNNLGEILVAAGQKDEARSDFERALALRPNYPEAENNLGYVDALDGAYPSAIGHFERALALQPKFPAAEYNLANAYLAENHPDPAMLHLRRAVQLQPTYSEAAAGLAYEEARSGDAAAAIHDYEQALASPLPFRHAAAAQAQLALLLAQSHRTAEAKSHFETSLVLDANDPTTHNNYGILLASTGDLLAAKFQFEEAVRLAPDFEEAKANLARAERTLR